MICKHYYQEFFSQNIFFHNPNFVYCTWVIFMEFIYYPKCSTCIKAKKYIEELGLNVTFRDIKENNPTKEELTTFYQKSNLPLKKFFNTSGLLYKEMNLKDKLKDMNEDEMLTLLSTNGMLVKRPLLIGDDFVLVGFKKEEVEKLV